MALHRLGRCLPRMHGWRRSPHTNGGFSARLVSSPSLLHILPRLEDFSCHNWRMGWDSFWHLCVRPGGAAQHPTIQRAGPHTKNI